MRCPVCDREQNLEEMSAEFRHKLFAMNSIADIAYAVFEFIGEVAEKKSPMMKEIGLVNAETGDDLVSVRLWAGVNETIFERLSNLRAENDSLRVRLAELQQP